MGESAKRCLLDDDVEFDSCAADIDPILLDGGVSFSEASMQPTSPAPIEADQLGSDIGEPQVIDSYNQKDILDRIDEARDYIQNKVMKNEKFAKVRSSCKNLNSQCAFWAALGECEKNPGTLIE